MPYMDGKGEVGSSGMKDRSSVVIVSLIFETCVCVCILDCLRGVNGA